MPNVKIGTADDQQEQCGDCRSNHAEVMEGSQPALQSSRRKRDDDRSQNDDSGVAEREEAGRNGRLAFLDLLAHDIVDGCYVVGTEGVPPAEHIGLHRGAEQRRPGGEGDRRPHPATLAATSKP